MASSALTRMAVFGIGHSQYRSQANQRAANDLRPGDAHDIDRSARPRSGPMRKAVDDRRTGDSNIVCVNRKRQKPMHAAEERASPPHPISATLAKATYPGSLRLATPP